MTYQCDRCGACCRGTLIVEAYDLDVLREPRILDVDINGRQPTLDELSDEGGKCLVLAANKPCRFLEGDTSCSIYPTRPNACVGMEPGSDQCQDARRLANLPPLPPVPSNPMI